MSKRTLFLPFLLLLFHQVALAQVPPTEWIKCFGGNYVDFEPAIEPTSDGGYIMVGETEGPGGDVTGYHGNIALGDYWVVKMDHQGTIQWSKCLGGTYFDQGQMVHQAPDGSFLVVGEAASLPGDGDVNTVNHGGTDYWMVKLSATGNILWEKSYGGEKNEYIYDFQFTADGGYILAGETESIGGNVSGNHGGRDAWIVKVNSAGAIDWQRCIGGSNDEEARSVVVLNDGYVITGLTGSNDGDVSGFHGGVFDMLAAKLDLNGNPVWVRSLGSDSQDQGWGTVKGSDGGVVISGWTGGNNGDVSGNHGDADFWLVKLNDQTGAIVWQKCYGGSFNELSYGLSVAADGGYLLGGYAESRDGQVTCMTSTSHSAWLVKTSATGTLLWQKTFSGGYVDEIMSVKPTPDGGIVAAGYTCVSTFPGYHKDMDPNNTVGDLFAVKLGPEVVSGPVSISISAPPANICAGAPLTLTAIAANVPANAVYKWFRNGTDVNNPTATYTAANFANADQVYCQVSVMTTSGCAVTPIPYTSNTVILSVSPLHVPGISISANATPFCEGGPMAFTAAVTGGSGTPVYQWLVNGNPAGTGGSGFSPTTLSNGDLVSCSYSDNTACVIPGGDLSNVIPVSILPVVKPSISISTFNTRVCAGNAVSFTATPVNGGTVPDYQWMINGAPTGVKTASFRSSSLADGDVVSCLLNSTAACAVPAAVPSNSIPIIVMPVNYPTLEIDYAMPVCSGLPVLFTLKTEKTVNPSYTWQLNGATAGTLDRYTAPSLTYGDKISCTMSDAANCSRPVTVSIVPAVYPTPVISHVAPLILSKGQSAVLDLSVTGDISTYEWTPATGLSDPTIANPLATPLRSTDYRLAVVSTDGCRASGEIQVKVTSTIAIPGAFTPNGDGHNDIFYVVGGPLGSVVKDLVIFDRWGHGVFQVHEVPPDDPAFGWNGTIGGRAAAAGTYVYTIRIGLADGTQQILKGTLVLIR